ncbi:MAG: glycosyltransferase family A protein [Pseudomonadota bacterium]
MSTPYASIIIPVYNDAEALKQCLNALEKQTYPSDFFEVIVVDNGSNQDIKTIILEYKQAKYAFESEPGSYSARNRGLSMAKGQVLGFTDADCIPEPTWITHGVNSLLNTSGCGLVAGKIEFFFHKENKPNVVEVYDLKSCLKQKKYLEEEHFGATANVFTFREVFETVGEFNASLKSGGDKEWGRRVFSHGYKQVYEERAIIKHPARYSWKEIRKKVLRVTEGLYRQEAKTRNSTRLIVEIFNHLKPSKKEIISIIQDDKLQGIIAKLSYFFLDFSLEHTKAYKKIQLLISDTLRDFTVKSSQGYSTEEF